MTARAAGCDPRTWQSPWPSTAYQKKIKSAAVLYRNAVVALNTSGTWEPASADSTLTVYGFLRLADADSITGDGTIEAIVDSGCKLLVGSGLTQADEGSRVYSVDDATFSKSSSGGTLPAMGLLMKVVDSTHGYVAIDPNYSLLAATADDVAAVAGSGNVPTDEWTNPAAVLTTALKIATATQVAPLTISSFVAGGVTALVTYPRNITFTGGSTTADCPSTVDLVGTDINDAALLETVALTAGSGTGVKAFKSLTSAAFGAGGGTAGTVAIGIGGKLGLSQPAKTRVGVVNVIREYAVNAVVTTGTYVIAATSPPNGTYAPSSAPDGTRDYALTYEKA